MLETDGHIHYIINQWTCLSFSRDNSYVPWVPCRISQAYSFIERFVSLRFFAIMSFHELMHTPVDMLFHNKGTCF